MTDPYGYDARGWRITENPGTQRDLSYSGEWQVVEERVGGQAQVEDVWSGAGQDTLLLMALATTLTTTPLLQLLAPAEAGPAVSDASEEQGQSH